MHNEYQMPDFVYQTLLFCMILMTLLIFSGHIVSRVLYLSMYEMWSYNSTVIFWGLMFGFLALSSSCEFGFCCTNCFECTCSILFENALPHTCVAKICADCMKIDFDAEDCAYNRVQGYFGECANGWERTWCEGNYVSILLPALLGLWGFTQWVGHLAWYDADSVLIDDGDCSIWTLALVRLLSLRPFFKMVPMMKIALIRHLNQD